MREAGAGSAGAADDALPAVTVIIPAFNAQRYLGRTLVSALAQTYPNLSILIIDDGSTDDTRAISEEAARSHPAVRTITTANSGVAEARNFGMQSCESRFVAFLDSDDLWHPTKIEKQVRALLQHDAEEGWVASYALFRIIDETGGVITDGLQEVPGGAILAEHLLENHVGNGSNLLVCREAALAVGGFDPDYARRGVGGCEDFDFQLRLLRRYRFAPVREYLIGYRSYAGNMSSDHLTMGRALAEVVERFSHEPGITPKRRKRALLLAQANAARRFAKGGAWRWFLRATGAMLALDPPGAVREMALLGSQTLRKIVGRLGREMGGVVGRPPQPRPQFDSLDPHEAI